MESGSARAKLPYSVTLHTGYLASDDDKFHAADRSDGHAPYSKLGFARLPWATGYGDIENSGLSERSPEIAERIPGNVLPTKFPHCALLHAGYACSVQVSHGEELRWRPNRGLGAPQPVNLWETSAWQRRKLYFKDRPLAQVVAEIDRYRAGAILITDPALKELRVSGIFPLDDPDGALEAVHQALGLDLTYVSPWLVLLHD